MEIKQGKVYLNFFRQGFLEKYGLMPYSDPHKPAVFYGCYPKQYSQILGHRGPAVIIFSGSDAIELNRNKLFASQLRRRPEFRFVAESNWISLDLAKAGIEHDFYPVTPFTFEDFTPVPLGNKVFFYTGHSPEHQKFYGKPMVDRIQERLPEFEFITLYSKPPDHIAREEMPSVYAQCFVGLRLVPHDGMSVSVIEQGCMGRRVIWNGESPNAIPWQSEDDVVNAILEESKKIGTLNTALSNEVLSFVNQPVTFLETDIKKVQMNIDKTYGCSVIINTVNEKPEKLKRAILSYQAQIGIDLELIISTIAGDPSIAMANEFKCKVVISRKKGIYEQLNKAVQQITKPWYAYASGNDVAMPMKLYSEISLCERTGKKVCYSDFYTQNENQNNKMIRRFFPYSFSKHLQGNFVNDCAVISTDLLKAYAPFKLEWGNFAYWDFWLRIYEGEGNVFVHNPTPTWNYLISPISLHIRRQKESPEYKKSYADLKARMLASHQPVEVVQETHEGSIAEVIDIVFPYAIEGNKIDELKYAIRSIEKNFNHPHRIVIVGDKPEWLDEKSCLFIPHQRKTGINSKLDDSYAKMRLICGHPEISENFIYWYDDIYLLQPVDVYFFGQLYYKEILDENFKGKTKHGKYLEKTIKFLQEHVGKGAYLNGETHIPRLFSKKMILDVMDTWSVEQNSLLINTLFINYINDVAKVELTTKVKAGFYGFSGPGSMKATEDVNHQVAKSIFLNHDDNGLNQFLKSFIQHQWPEKSKCEL